MTNLEFRNLVERVAEAGDESDLELLAECDLVFLEALCLVANKYPVDLVAAAENLWPEEDR